MGGKNVSKLKEKKKEKKCYYIRNVSMSFARKTEKNNMWNNEYENENKNQPFIADKSVAFILYRMHVFTLISFLTFPIGQSHRVRNLPIN